MLNKCPKSYTNHASGKRAIQMALIRQIMTANTAIHIFSTGNRQNKNTQDNVIIAHAKYLAERGIA